MIEVDEIHVSFDLIVLQRLERIMSDVESNGRAERSGERGGKNSGGYEGPVDEKFAEYVNSLLKERDTLDQERYPIIHRLIQQGKNKVNEVRRRCGVW